MLEERTLVSFDWAIKYLLRNKADYVVLEGFLTTLLGKEIKIKNLTDSESNKTSENNKYNRTDVLGDEILDLIAKGFSTEQIGKILEERKKQ